MLAAKDYYHDGRGLGPVDGRTNKQKHRFLEMLGRIHKELRSLVIRANHADVFMMAAIVDSEGAVLTFEDAELVPVASDIREPDHPQCLSVICSSSVGSPCEAQHPADYRCRIIVLIEIVFADGSPFAVDEDLDSAKRGGGRGGVAVVIDDSNPR